MTITIVKHVDIFLAIYRDFQRVGQLFVHGKKADLFATALRVLELMRNEQITLLKASGIKEKDITEDMLGFAMTWQLFNERSLGHYSKSSFERILKEVLSAGAARRMYVKCHRHKRENGHEELDLVCDTSGRPCLYETTDAAKEDKQTTGDIIHYFFFNAQAVNDLIQEIYQLARPQPPTPDNDQGNGNKNGGAQPTLSGDWSEERTPEKDHEREGKSGTESSDRNITHPSDFDEGVNSPKRQKSQSRLTPTSNDVATPLQNPKEPASKSEPTPRQSTSNKNLIGKNSESIEETIISARAIDPLLLSQFDFSQTPTPENILQLSRILYAPLPERYKTEEDKEAAYARIDAAALAIAAMPLVKELGLRSTAALMAYQADEESPCTWRPKCRKKYNNPGFVPRLWNLESETVMWKMSQEMESAGWWPEYVPRGTGLVEAPPIIDLAELAGIEPQERIGMDASTCQVVEDWLREQIEPHGYTVTPRRVGAARSRGWCIEVKYQDQDGSQRGLRFYHFDDWELIMDADEVAPMGSVEFVNHLSEAIKRSQVA